MKGRKRKPTTTKKLHGTNRKDRQRDDEPKPELVAPDAPAHLSPAAREEWDRIVPDLLLLGLISKLDRAALAGYCAAWGRWVDIENELKTQGSVLVNNNGVAAINPCFAAADRALKQMHSFLVEFGLSPSSRTRVAPNVPKAGKNATRTRDRSAVPKGAAKTRTAKAPKAAKGDT